jgi:hypothetical protein
MTRRWMRLATRINRRQDPQQEKLMLEQPKPQKVSPESIAALRSLADKVASNARMQHAIKAALANMGMAAPMAQKQPKPKPTLQQRALERGNPAAAPVKTHPQAT